MKTFKIYYQKESALTKAFEEKYNTKKISELSMFDKLLFRTQEFPDIYFCNRVEENSIDFIKNSKLTIVNSMRLKKEILNAGNDISESKIEVFYPSFIPQDIKPKEAKISLLNELNIENKKTKIILFYAKNLKSSGAKEFIDVITKLTEKNFIAIIAGEAKQIYTLKFQITKYIDMPNLFLVENFENPDLLFAASDIYVLPTYQKSFSVNVIKAMYYKCAVFVSNISDSAEIIDVFATLDGAEDKSTYFKVNALLMNPTDMKLIKKENKKIAEKLILETQLQRLDAIIENL